MTAFIRKHRHLSIVLVFITLFSLYFSVFTILRAQGMYANYYDLGIMHQTTYNSYQALRTGDWGRMLEQTNPFGPEQIKRMAIHTDFLMVLIAPLYFIHDGPETLLIVQAVTVALGALAVYGIALHVFAAHRLKALFAITFALCYLFNPLVQWTTIYEFHSVTLATNFLLFMFYFWLKKQYRFSFAFFLLSLVTKEQVALTTAFFGLYIILKDIDITALRKKGWAYLRSYSYSWYGILILSTSIVWFLLCVKVIIPYFRVDDQYHFALGFYEDFGDTPLGVIIGILTNPLKILSVLFSPDRLWYLFVHLGSLGFLALLSPITLFIAAPEFGITMLSSNGNMRDITLHYTAVITPFVFISSIYGTAWFLTYAKKRISSPRLPLYTTIYLTVWTVAGAFTVGPLPGSFQADTKPWTDPLPYYAAVQEIKQTIITEDDKVSTTGSLAPHFTDRRYFYDFSSRYRLADYVVISQFEVYNGWGKDWMPGVYDILRQDPQFERVYERNQIEVYRNTN